MTPERSTLLAEFMIFQRANPLPRHRNTKRGRIYQPKSNQLAVLADLKLYPPCNIGGAVIMDALMAVTRLPGDNSRWPIRREYGDKDNLEKGIADNLVSAGHLKDDRLVIGGDVYKVFGDEDFITIKLYRPKE